MALCKVKVELEDSEGSGTPVKHEAGLASLVLKAHTARHQTSVSMSVPSA